MIYAVKKDGTGFRLISEESDAADDEYISNVVPERSIYLAKQAKLADLQARYNAEIQHSVSYTTTGGVTKTFQADSSSQVLLMQASQGFTMSGTAPDGFYWVAEDNTKVPFALVDLYGLYGVMLLQGWDKFQHLQAAKEYVRVAATVADVDAVEW